MDYVKRLEKLMTRLRAPGGCPWDRRQTHKSLKPYLLEESHEVLDAIDRGGAQDLREELGDLLLQVVFHSQMAKEKGKFNFQQVAKTIGDKLVRRHPHVFGPKGASRKMKDINRKWEELKRREKPERKSALDGLPKSLPALLRAQRMRERITKGQALPKSSHLKSSLTQQWTRFIKTADSKNASKREKALGELLFALTQWAGERGAHAEMALGKAADRFERAYRKSEKAADQK
jgi:tetrapyrrole methylase family protein/MazG family protein